MSYPLNDENMIYDLDKGMYILTKDGANNLLGINIQNLSGGETESDIILEEVSQDIYDYISMYSQYNTYDIKRWLIAKDSTLRDKFMRILSNQLRYYVRSGAGALKDSHGVQIEKQKFLKLNVLRGDVAVSYSVERQLTQMGLLYTGTMYFPHYEEDGTW